MARKHFTQYFKKIQQQYIDATNHANTLIQLCEKQEVEKEVVDRFVQTMRPICDTYAIFEKINSLLIYDERKERKHRPILLEHYEQVDENTDKYTPAQIVKDNEICLQELDEQIQGIKI